jgi:replicative DNA helicase
VAATVLTMNDARRRQHGDLARVPPHDLDSEAALLGALLLHQPAQAGLIGEAVQICTVEDFYKPAHGHVFEAIGSLHAGGEPVEPLTVADGLRRAGTADALGPNPLAELTGLLAGVSWLSG